MILNLAANILKPMDIDKESSFSLSDYSLSQCDNKTKHKAFVNPQPRKLIANINNDNKYIAAVGNPKNIHIRSIIYSVFDGQPNEIVNSFSDVYNYQHSFYLKDDIGSTLSIFNNKDPKYCDDQYNNPETYSFERILNETGSSRKKYNQITRPSRQFIHPTDHPKPMVYWSDTNKLNATHCEVNTILCTWKRKSRKRLSQIWNQTYSSRVKPTHIPNLHERNIGSSAVWGESHGFIFPKPDFLKVLDSTPKLDTHKLNVQDDEINYLHSCNEKSHFTNSFSTSNHISTMFSTSAKKDSINKLTDSDSRIPVINLLSSSEYPKQGFNSSEDHKNNESAKDKPTVIQKILNTSPVNGISPEHSMVHIPLKQNLHLLSNTDTQTSASTSPALIETDDSFHDLENNLVQYELTDDTTIHLAEFHIDEKLHNITLGSHQLSLSSKKAQDDDRIDEIVNSLPDLSFYFS